MNKEISQVLRSCYERKKADNPAVSLRYLGRRLDVSVSYVHQVMSGKKVASPDFYHSLSDLLDIDLEKRDRILSLVMKSKGFRRAISPSLLGTKESDGRGPDWKLAPRKSFRFLRKWHYVPVLECTKLAAYDGSPDFVARKLSLPLEEVKKAFAELQAEGLLKEKEGRLVKSENFLDFASKQSREDMREYHLNNLGIAARVLKEQTSDEDIEKRLFFSFTLGCRDEDIALAKQRITHFIQELSKELPSPNADRVYQVALQLVPLDKQ